MIEVRGAEKKGHGVIYFIFFFFFLLPGVGCLRAFVIKIQKLDPEE